MKRRRDPDDDYRAEDAYVDQEWREALDEKRRAVERGVQEVGIVCPHNLLDGQDQVNGEWRHDPKTTTA